MLTTRSLAGISANDEGTMPDANAGSDRVPP
jgi:hypothetical protein